MQVLKTLLYAAYTRFEKNENIDSDKKLFNILFTTKVGNIMCVGILVSLSGSFYGQCFDFKTGLNTLQLIENNSVDFDRRQVTLCRFRFLLDSQYDESDFKGKHFCTVDLWVTKLEHCDYNCLCHQVLQLLVTAKLRYKSRSWSTCG